MKCFIVLLICLSFLSVNVIGGPPPEVVEFFSFEQDFEGWMPESILLAGSTDSITRSQDRAIDGQTSVKLDLHSRGEVPTAAAWIQRGFTLAPNELYQVQVRYFFATADGGGPMIPGPTSTMAGAVNNPPASLNDVLPFVHGYFFSDRSPRYRWFRQQFEFTAQADNAGGLSVMIGVVAAGLSGSYYIDSVRVEFTKRLAGAVQPVVGSASIVGKKLTIQGSAFGPSPRVIINDEDRSDFIVAASDGSLTLRGSRSALGLIRLNNLIRVVDDTTAAASESFDLIMP